MEPTLEIGDRVLVNKLSYNLHDVHRGDIVVFAAEPNAEWHRAGIDDLVKRVIALPGETITQCETDRVCIDGRVLDESYLPKGTVTDHPHDAALHHGHRRASRCWCATPTAPRVAARCPRARYS